MYPTQNRQVLLKARPLGIPQAEHFELISGPVPELRPGELLVRNDFLSIDPGMRGWVNAASNYSNPVAIGEVMRSFCAGVVIASRNSQYTEGERVMGLFGWQEYAVTDGSAVRRKVVETDLSLSLSLGILGINGVTAYLGFTEIGEPRPGDTVVVSTAAGAVGSAVGQIAKIAGCRTVGITGSQQKVRTCVEEFGFDAAIDYKSADFEPALAAACPDGVNIYFDNTAGSISDAVLPRIAKGARIIVCGTASIASWDPAPIGPRVERHLLVNTARMQGFLVLDYEHRMEEVVARLAAWVRAGKLRYREEILDGIEQAPGSIAGLYRGENAGKRLVKISHPDSSN